MSEAKPIPRHTKVAAAAVFGGLAAITIGQRFTWALESQTNSLLLIGAGMAAGLIASLSFSRQTAAHGSA